MPSNDGTPNAETHRYHEKALDLQEGDRVLFNDRSRPLTVVGEHARQNASRTWRRRGESKYYRVVELEGNGTQYHLLALDGSSTPPMLYKEADWDDDKTNRIGVSPRYSRAGERVEEMEVLEDGE